MSKPRNPRDHKVSLSLFYPFRKKKDSIRREEGGNFWKHRRGKKAKKGFSRMAKRGEGREGSIFIATVESRAEWKVLVNGRDGDLLELKNSHFGLLQTHVRFNKEMWEIVAKEGQFSCFVFILLFPFAVSSIQLYQNSYPAEHTIALTR